MRKRMNFNNNMRNNNNMNRNNNNRMRRPMGGGGGGRKGGSYEGDDDMVNPRQRKHAMNMRDKYINQGRDAMMSGDRVQAEYWFQHADHYARILNAIDELFASRPQTQEGGEGGDYAEDHGAENESDGGDDEAGERQPGSQSSGQQGQRQKRFQNDGGQPRQDRGPRERGAWRPREERQGEAAPAQPAAPQAMSVDAGMPTHAEEIGLPLSAVLPAARADEEGPAPAPRGRRRATSVVGSEE